jgi:hypothetical protein
VGISPHDFKSLGPRLASELAAIMGVELMQVWFVPRRLA